MEQEKLDALRIDEDRFDADVVEQLAVANVDLFNGRAQDGLFT